MRGQQRGSSSSGLPGRLSMLFLAMLAVCLLLVVSHFAHYHTLLPPAAQMPVVIRKVAPKSVQLASSKLRSLSKEEQERDNDRMCISWGATGQCVTNNSILLACAKTCAYFVHCESCKYGEIMGDVCLPCRSPHARHDECVELSSLDGQRLLAGRFPPSHVDRRLELPADSRVVLEVGGNMGDDLAAFVRSLGPEAKVFTCEPVQDFYTALEQQYIFDPRVVVFRYGVADKDFNTTFKIEGLGGQASGGLNDGFMSGKQQGEVRRVPVVLRDADAVFKQVRDMVGQPPDSLSINCEGCEYLMLRRLLDQGWMPRVAYLQVSWHSVDAVEDRVGRRCEMERALRQTHDLIWYDGFFGWQGWQRRTSEADGHRGDEHN